MNLDEEIRKIRSKYRGDEESEEPEKESNKLSTHLPYALCKSVGINTAGMSPSEAWKAYNGKTGKSPAKEMKKAVEKKSASKKAKKSASEKTKAKKKEAAKEPKKWWSSLAGEWVSSEEEEDSILYAGGDLYTKYGDDMDDWPSYIKEEYGEDYYD